MTDYRAHELNCIDAAIEFANERSVQYAAHTGRAAMWNKRLENLYAIRAGVYAHEIEDDFFHARYDFSDLVRKIFGDDVMTDTAFANAVISVPRNPVAA